MADDAAGNEQGKTLIDYGGDLLICCAFCEHMTFQKTAFFAHLTSSELLCQMSSRKPLQRQQPIRTIRQALEHERLPSLLIVQW